MNGTPEAGQVLCVGGALLDPYHVRERLQQRFAVEEVADGVHGLTLAIDSCPDLILAAEDAAGIDGLALLAALKDVEETAHIPVVVVGTPGGGGEGRRVAALDAGADGYLERPLDPDVVLPLVDNLIRSRRRLRALWGGGAPADGAAAPTVEPSAPASDAVGAADPQPDGADPALAGLKRSDRAFVERVLAAARANLCAPDFSVDTLAYEVGVSARQLRRRYGRLTDESPSEMVQRLKVARALELLAEGDRPVKEIAFESGFQSASGLRHALRSHVGKTPTELLGDEDE